MPKAPRSAPAPSRRKSPGKPPAPPPATPLRLGRSISVKKLGEELAAALNELETAKTDARHAEERLRQFEPYEPELRTALREAECALLRLARTAACGLVNHAEIAGTTSEKQTTRATLAVITQGMLATVRGAQETARKHGLIVTP